MAKRELDYYSSVPNDIMLFLTYRCTSRCKTCNMWKRSFNKNKELTLVEYKRFIDEICEYGGHYRNVEMFGGDALLRKDALIPLIRYVKDKGIPRCSLPTNGNLLDRETASALVNSGLDILEVSIDSISEVHNKIRGVDNTFERAKNAIINILEARRDKTLPKVQVNCTISKLNIDSFEKLLPFAEEIGADVIAFEYVGEFPKSIVSSSEINGRKASPYFVSENGSNLLNTAQAELLKYKINKIRDESKKMSVYCVTMNIDTLKIENLISGRFSSRKCYMSRSLITLDPYGNIIGCPFFDSYVIGNIRKNRFSEIWNNKEHKIFMNLVNNGKTKPKICDYCILSVERNPSFLFSIKRRLFYVNRKYS